MKILRKKHEQSLIDGFAEHFKRQAEKAGRRVTKCSLDGQDVVLGSDYMFTDNSRFMLIEFKYEASDLAAERAKHRRKNMCLLLDADDTKRSLSVKCHYVCWSVKKAKRQAFMNSYYHEICNRKIFGEESGLSRVDPDANMKLGADLLIKNFLDQSAGYTFFAFKTYCEWLMSLENGSDAVEILLDNPDDDQLEFLEFGTLVQLKSWLEKQQFKPKRPGLTI